MMQPPGWDNAHLIQVSHPLAVIATHTTLQPLTRPRLAPKPADYLLTNWLPSQTQLHCHLKAQQAVYLLASG